MFRRIVRRCRFRIYHISASGEVSETAEADYPDEEDPEDLIDEGRERRLSSSSSSSRLLRGQTSLDINFDHAAKAKLQEHEHRDLQSSPVEIDVLVAYTQYALSSVGTRQQMTDLVNLAFAETNGAYAASGVNVVINLVYLHEDTSGYNIDQTDTSSMSPSLNALRLTSDGNLDYIHQMRIDYGADMVALITAGVGCGIAYLNSGYSTMFSVTSYDCAIGYYSFAHELGMLYKLAAVFFFLSFSFDTHINVCLFLSPFNIHRAQHGCTSRQGNHRLQLRLQLWLPWRDKFVPFHPCLFLPYGSM